MGNFCFHSLQELWSSQNHSNLKQALSVFHRELTSECEKQLVFVDRHLTLMDSGARAVCAGMASDVLTAMEPPLQETFENWLTEQGDVLESVLEILDIQLRLAVSLERVVCSDENDKSIPEILKLAGTLFTFLRSAVSRYAQYQEQQIQRKLQSMVIPDRSVDLRTLQEFHASLKKNGEKLFTLLLAAEITCNERTQSSCYPGFLDATSKLLRSFIENCRKDLSLLVQISTDSDSFDHWDLVNEVLQRVNCAASFRKTVGELSTKARAPFQLLDHG